MGVRGRVRMTGEICPHNLNATEDARAWMRSRAGQYVTIVDGPLNGDVAGYRPCELGKYEVSAMDARYPEDTRHPIVCGHEIEIGD